MLRSAVFIFLALTRCIAAQNDTNLTTSSVQEAFSNAKIVPDGKAWRYLHVRTLTLTLFSFTILPADCPVKCDVHGSSNGRSSVSFSWDELDHGA